MNCAEVQALGIHDAHAMPCTCAGPIGVVHFRTYDESQRKAILCGRSFVQVASDVNGGLTRQVNLVTCENCREELGLNLPDPYAELASAWLALKVATVDRLAAFIGRVMFR